MRPPGFRPGAAFHTPCKRRDANGKAYHSERKFRKRKDLPFEETLRRHRTKPNRDDFGESDMRRWWGEKDWIGLLPETVLTSEVSLEAAANLIVHDVTGR